MDRTPEQMAQLLADMQCGDYLSKLEMSATEAHELGKAFLALQKELTDLQAEFDFRVTC